jgi:hypothetical protein
VLVLKVSGTVYRGLAVVGCVVSVVKKIVLLLDPPADAKLTVTVSLKLPPGGLAVTVRGGTTVTVVVPVKFPKLAVTLATPGVSAVNKPAGVIVPRTAGVTAQVT